MATGYFCKAAVSVLVLLALVAPAAAAAQEPTTAIPQKMQDEHALAQKGSNVLRELMNAPDRGIPGGLLQKAYAIAVVPNVLKGAFLIGGRWGKGLLSVRQNGSWGTPIFIELAGGSLGFQVGVESMDLVLVFAEKDSVQSLLDSKLKLGVNASVAAGPVGRQASASTDAKLDAAIYSYSRAKGFFAGIALDGALITPDERANRDVYGMTGGEALRSAQASSPATEPFIGALGKYSPAKSDMSQ